MPLLAQENSLSGVLMALADEKSVAAEAASVLVVQNGKPVACQIGSKEARCMIQGNLIHPNVFLPSFNRGNGDRLRVRREEWSDNNQFMIVQVNPNHDSWLPVESVESADAAVTDIHKLAESRELFDCWEHDCQVILSVHNGERQIFARCSTIEIDGIRSFPNHCSPMLFEAKDKAWIKAVTEYIFNGINPASPISETFAVRAAASLGIDDAALIQAVDTALNKSPFIF
jgi:hypothetical protein